MDVVLGVNVISTDRMYTSVVLARPAKGRQMAFGSRPASEMSNVRTLGDHVPLGFYIY